MDEQYPNMNNENTPNSNILLSDDSGYLTNTPSSSVSIHSGASSNESSLSRSFKCEHHQTDQFYTPGTCFKCRISLHKKKTLNKNLVKPQGSANHVYSSQTSVLFPREAKLSADANQYSSANCEINDSSDMCIIDYFNDLRVENDVAKRKTLLHSESEEFIQPVLKDETHKEVGIVNMAQGIKNKSKLPHKDCVKRLKLENNLHLLPNSTYANTNKETIVTCKCIHCLDFRCNKKSKSAVHSNLSYESSTCHQRSLMGLKYVDFLMNFGEYRSYPWIVAKIFEYLESKDLVRVPLVSRAWNRIMNSSRKANNRRVKYITCINQCKENWELYNPKKDRQVPRKGILLQIQNLNKGIITPSSSLRPVRSPPVSPSKVRFQLYLKAGNTLERGEKLIPCPRCSLPSRIKPDIKSAQCSRMGCQYFFCCLCLCESHEGKQCPISPARYTKKRHPSVGSKESKKNLRRL